MLLIQTSTHSFQSRVQRIHAFNSHAAANPGRRPSSWIGNDAPEARRGVSGLLMRFSVSGGFERSAGSLADLVQFILERVDRPSSSSRDKHSAVTNTLPLGSKVAFCRAILTHAGSSDVPGLMSSSKALETLMQYLPSIGRRIIGCCCVNVCVRP